MGKPYDISREDLLSDRTSFIIFDLRILVHGYLMIVVYRTKGLKHNLFYLCVCACVSVYVFLAILQCIFISYYICRQQII